MNDSTSPCASNSFLVDHVDLLCNSFYHWTGRELIDPHENRVGRARALFEAPFAVASHDTATDPIFNYANLKALELFEMDWQAFTSLPSRLSAEAAKQEDRQRLLDIVAGQGYMEGYSGIRISASGRRFTISDAVIWNLIDGQGRYAGQAAMFADWASF